jgi:hypothetical protein
MNCPESGRADERGAVAVEEPPVPVQSLDFHDATGADVGWLWRAYLRGTPRWRLMSGGACISPLAPICAASLLQVSPFDAALVRSETVLAHAENAAPSPPSCQPAPDDSPRITATHSNKRLDNLT